MDNVALTIGHRVTLPRVDELWVIVRNPMADLQSRLTSGRIRLDREGSAGALTCVCSESYRPLAALSTDGEQPSQF
jgi:hypothetical protein